jgi:ATP-dependent DNA helicase RecQ
VTAGWVDFTTDEKPVVLLTEAGRAVMKAEQPARLLLPSRANAAAGGGSRSRGERGGRRSASAVAEAEIHGPAAAVFTALRAHRLALSRAQGVPPYVVASDRTLREMAVLQPRTLGELMSVHGIGPAKVDRYGRGFLDTVARALTPSA